MAKEEFEQPFFLMESNTIVYRGTRNQCISEKAEGQKIKKNPKFKWIEEKSEREKEIIDIFS